MSDIRIIFFDIDGTLVDPATGCISPKTKEALIRLHQNGILLCVATGRPPASLPDLSDLPFSAFLTCNGGLCYTREELIFQNPMAFADVQKITENAAGLGRPVTVAVRQRLAANGWDQDLADYYRLAGLELTVAEDFEQVSRQPVYQIMLGCRLSDHEAILRGTEGVSITYSWDRASDVIPLGNGKDRAVAKILGYFGLSAQEAAAFGDGHNDIQMLRSVGTGVAMGNASEAVKSAANAVCAPVSEEGIYRYCIDHGLI